MGNWKGFGLTAAAALSTFAVASGSSSLIEYLRDVKILRAYGEPAITIAYDHLNASRVEIYVNGASWGTRSLDPGKSADELAINFNLAALKPGANLIEVKLFDAGGRLVGKQSAALDVDKQQNQPVYIRLPRNGETLQGTVEIQVGLGVQARGLFVSFFVDKQFKGLKNVAPYSFLWDTTQEANGWHEIEIWTYDETQTTRKSPIAKVFIQNPGGRTDRQDDQAEPKVSDPKVGAATGAPIEAKTAQGVINNQEIHAAAAPAMLPSLSGNRVSAPIGRQADAKTSVGAGAITVSQRIVVPSSTLMSNPVVAVSTTNANGVKTNGAKVSIATDPRISLSYGTRVANDGPFSIFLGSDKVAFDVSPYVENGVPFTPFRHLFEAAGGKVDWDHIAKVVNAVGQNGEVWLKIGNMYAKVNGKSVQLESAPFIKQGRTIVPLSFMRDALEVDVEFDTATGHVLITQASNRK